jgi:hypothetical protein
MNHIMINYRRCAIALATLAFAGTTLGTAAPAFANEKQVVKTVTTLAYGNKGGAGCDVEGGTVPDGSTVTKDYTYSDGSTAQSKSECRNGGWFPARHTPQQPMRIAPGSLRIAPIG